MDDWHPIDAADEVKASREVVLLICEGEVHYGKWLVTENVLRPDFSEYFTWEGWQVHRFNGGKALSFNPTEWRRIPKPSKEDKS